MGVKLPNLVNAISIDYTFNIAVHYKGNTPTIIDLGIYIDLYHHGCHGKYYLLDNGGTYEQTLYNIVLD